MSVESSALNVERSAPHGAVFLSYARDDAAAARRIAEALRASGLEVWFDENELRGGDAWDAKIRQQIDACVLFLAVISKHTQERSKGYFRLEWKLAVDQTHLLAAGVPFIAPVVVDDTPEGGAIVPPEFLRVQWMRLPGALPTPQFVEQVNRLLSKEPLDTARDRQGAPRHGSGQAGSGEQPRPRPAPPDERTAGTKKSAPLAALGISLGVVAVSVGVVFFVTGRRESAEAAARRNAPPTPVATPDPKSQTPEPISRPPPADAKSIAVLPFANLSADKENEFFTDGMHDEVITALAKIHDLTVISRSSVMAYRNPEGRNLKKIASELGVATVLEGSVQRAGNQVKVIVQLIDARTDRHLWARSYVENLTDVFSIQSKLTDAITTALQATLSPAEKSLIARRPTENQAAYELYLRARLLDQSLGARATKAEYERLLGAYEQAAAMDPAFALPHVQASIVHGTMYWFDGLDATPARREKARAALAAAQRLAPGAPETYLAQGSFEYTCRNDWASALKEYHAAEAGLPNDALLHFRIGLAHRRLGQLPEALARMERAVVLDPNVFGQLIQWINTAFFLRRYAQVLDLTNHYLALFPTERLLKETRLRTRYELDGDRAAYLQAWVALPAGAHDPHGLLAAYIAAMLTNDLAAADRVLADPRMSPVASIDGSISDPVELHRAFVAWLGGRPDEARQFADQAIAAYRGRKWAPRQQPWAQLGIARAEAYAGRMDDALRAGKAALDAELASDAFSALAMRNEYGRILVVGNRREEAIATLREMMSAPGGFSSNEIRFDPVWSRLKDDPRFEEILRSAKPL